MNGEQEIDQLKERVTKLEGRIDNLEMWQEKQNGSIQRIESYLKNLDDKIDNKAQKFLFTFLGSAVSIIIALLTLLFRLQ